MPAAGSEARSPEPADDKPLGTNRACDGCRTRKRKCDGLQPYCTNCIKSVTRDEDGNPVCTYRIEAKKRGPRPGYKDRMLQRLERLESILRPLVDPATSTSAASDTPRSPQNSNSSADASAQANPRKRPFQQVIEMLDAIEGASQSALIAGSAVHPAKHAAVAHQPVLVELPDDTSPSATFRRFSEQSDSQDDDVLRAVPGTATGTTTPAGHIHIAHHPHHQLHLPGNGSRNPTHTSPSGLAAHTPASHSLNLLNELSASSSVGTAPPQGVMASHQLSWAQPVAGAGPAAASTARSVAGQHHIAHLGQLGQSAPAATGVDLSSFYLNNPAIFSSLAYPSILDPFPSIFAGPFTNTPSLSNIALLDASTPRHSSVQDLECHLVMLGLTYNLAVPISSKHAAEISSPKQFVLSLPRALRDALAATGVFFSSHPELYSSILAADPSASTGLPPANGSKIDTRIRIARMYMLRARKALKATVMPAGSTHLNSVNEVTDDGTPVEPLDDCDAVRAMLLLVSVAFGLGDGGDSMQLIADAYRLAQKAKIYEASIQPTIDPTPPQLTVDSLVISVPRMITAKPNMSKLTSAEIFDRRVLWAACLILDTYCSMASGYQSGIDEGDYPGLVDSFSLADLVPSVSVPEPPALTRASPSRLAENTIWEATPFAVMFDDVSEMSRATMRVSSSSGEFESQIHLTFIMRRVMRYARSHMASPSVVFPSYKFDHLPDPLRDICSVPRDQQGGTASLHNLLLAWYAHFPERFRAFPSLESFARGVHLPLLDEFRDWIFSIYAVESILTFLSAFSYLHLPLLSTPDAHRKMYRLSAPKSDSALGVHSPRSAAEAAKDAAGAEGSGMLWSSQQVLLACFRALTYMIQRLYTPTAPSQSPFPQQTYDEERLHYCQQLPLNSETPSPALCWTIQSLNIFITSSAGLMAARSRPEGVEAVASHHDAIVRLINTLVLPSLERISKVYPMAQLYHFKLAALLKGGTAEEWAREALSYVQL